MIRHVSLLTFVEAATDAQIHAIEDALVDACPPGSRSCAAYAIGRDLAINEGNASFAVVADFDDRRRLPRVPRRPRAPAHHRRADRAGPRGRVAGPIRGRLMAPNVNRYRHRAVRSRGSAHRFRRCRPHEGARGNRERRRVVAALALVSLGAELRARRLLPGGVHDRRHRRLGPHDRTAGLPRRVPGLARRHPAGRRRTARRGATHDARGLPEQHRTRCIGTNHSGGGPSSTRSTIASCRSSSAT